jgi:hypothetical protein
LTLDVIAHGTPLLYPASMRVVGVAPVRVVGGGIWAYLTDPIFLLEPLFLGATSVHWILGRRMASYVQRLVLAMTMCVLLLSTGVFASLLPVLQGLLNR